MVEPRPLYARKTTLRIEVVPGSAQGEHYVIARGDGIKAYLTDSLPADLAEIVRLHLEAALAEAYHEINRRRPA